MECLSTVTHIIGCFLPDLYSMYLKSFPKPKALPVTGDGVTSNTVTPPYPGNPALLTSGPRILPKHSFSDFCIEMYLYLL